MFESWKCSMFAFPTHASTFRQYILVLFSIPLIRATSIGFT